MAELQLEALEDAEVRRVDILEKLDPEDEDEEMLKPQEREELYRTLNKLNTLLGYPEEVQDDLIDRWERELAEGRIPDLDETR